MDNKYRYAISAISDYHFVTNQQSKKNLDKICDNVYDIGYFLPKNKTCMLEKNKSLFKKLKKPYFLITYHPNTLQILIPINMKLKNYSDHWISSEMSFVFCLPIPIQIFIMN